MASGYHIGQHRWRDLRSREWWELAPESALGEGSSGKASWRKSQQSWNLNDSQVVVAASAGLEVRDSQLRNLRGGKWAGAANGRGWEGRGMGEGQMGDGGERAPLMKVPQAILMVFGLDPGELLKGFEQRPCRLRFQFWKV